MVKSIVQSIIALAISAGLFIGVLQFMPTLWRDLAVMLDLPKGFYDVVGFGGLTLIAFTVILLKNGFYGSNPDKNPWFVGLNALGACLHLVSFGHYYNPNGITLDTVYVLVGVYGLLSIAFSDASKNILEKTDAPSLGRFVLVVGTAQLAILALIWVVWPSVMEFTQQYNTEFFHYAGTLGGISLLACFIGQVLGLINSRSWLYDLIYSIGIWGYIINLSIEFNPYTVALECMLFIFLFVKIKK